MIEINDKYRITSDQYGVTLQKSRVSKKGGKVTWSNAGYYSNYKDTLHALVDKEVLGVETLQELVDKIE